MHSPHKQIQETRIPHEQTVLPRQIEATDYQIGALVYELYGLTEEEIGIVEGIHDRWGAEDMNLNDELRARI